MHAARRPIRTLIVEDSTTVRRLLVSIFDSDARFEVVGEAADGAEALLKALKLKPDLITMDIEMPGVDGIEATKAIMRECPTPIMIVTAGARSGNVELSLNAMQAGALMVVDKPVNPTSGLFELQAEQLLSMAVAMADVKVVRQWERVAQNQVKSSISKERPLGLVAIGASAGGPAALRRIFIDLPPKFPVPIVVVQHIARGFVEGLVRWLGLNCPLSVKVVGDNEPLLPDTIYIAPDNRHLGVSADGVSRLSSAPVISGFRPSVSYLFDSCGRAYGANMVGVILTGMGNDGAEGLRVVHEAGGRVIAQDEASSVVYGMAREAVRAGVVDEILSVDKIGNRLIELVSAI